MYNIYPCIKTKIVEVFETSDGQYFKDEKAAYDHQADIIGEMLDDLVANDDAGRVTRSDRYSILINMLKDPQLHKKIEKIKQAMEYFNND